MAKLPSEYALLGFDFGLRRIGVAVGQTITQTATPLKTLKAHDGIPNWAEIASLISQWEARVLVVGRPLNMDGSTQEIARLANKFKNRLSGRFNLPVYAVDERLTTIEAKKLAKTNIDSIAAKLILESWLREQ